jgi:hypothetical protein
MMGSLPFYSFVTSLKKSKRKKVVAQGTFSDFNRVLKVNDKDFSHTSKVLPAR